MVQIYFKKWENNERGFNKISTNSKFFLTFFHLQPILYRKSPADSIINWTFLDNEYRMIYTFFLE